MPAARVSAAALSKTVPGARPSGSNDISTAANRNRSPWFRRYGWTDRNGNGFWDEGEQGNLLVSQGGVASTVVDPNLENTHTRELSANDARRNDRGWEAERASGNVDLAELGVRVGDVVNVHEPGQRPAAEAENLLRA